MRQVTGRELRYRPHHGGVPSVDGDLRWSTCMAALQLNLTKRRALTHNFCERVCPGPESFDHLQENRFDDIRAWELGLGNC